MLLDNENVFFDMTGTELNAASVSDAMNITNRGLDLGVMQAYILFKTAAATATVCTFSLVTDTVATLASPTLIGSPLIIGTANQEAGTLYSFALPNKRVVRAGPSTLETYLGFSIAIDGMEAGAGVMGWLGRPGEVDLDHRGNA